MSSPYYGMSAPAAILITWSSADGAWLATSVDSIEPIEIRGPSSSLGDTPAYALDVLLSRRFCILTDDDCPATMVRINEIENQPQAAG